MANTVTGPTNQDDGERRLIVYCSVYSDGSASSTTLVDLEVLRSSATFEIFKQKSVATNTTTELLSQPLVLQESDVLKAQANAANQVHIIVSFMEVTKGQL